MNVVTILVLLVGLGLIIGLALLFIIRAAGGGGRGSSNPPPPVQATGLAPEQKQAERTRILQALAEGKMSREEAEGEMNALRQGPPTSVPTGGRGPARGNGCLWAVLLGVVVAVALLSLLLLMSFFGLQVSPGM
jgi:hypothetical protein